MLTSILRSYARWRNWRRDRTDAVGRQRRLLARLVSDASRTRFGRDHGFAGIDGPDAFRRRVPLRSYEDFWREYWQPDFPRLVDATAPGTIAEFALSSGTTTGTTKYIPYSRAMSGAAMQGMLDLLCHHVQARPASRLLAGSAIMLSGPEVLEELSDGIHAGDVSALASLATPRLARGRILPPPATARLGDWEAKIARIAELSRGRRITAMGGSPNWTLMYLEAVARSRPGTSRLAEWYPDLELILHGGVNFAPYRRRFAELMAGGHAETREVYSASEGFFAYADRGDGEGMRLLADGAIFFEFVPVEDLSSAEPVRHWLGTIETGVEYAVVLNTAAGLWGYVLGDTVRFVDTDPARLLVTGRTTYRLSAFGEHLIEEELADAVAAAAAAVGSDIVEYCCTARVAPGDRAGGAHEFIVECQPAVSSASQREAFTRALDARLAELNDDYRSLRRRDYNLQRPHVHFVPARAFAEWMKAHRGLGGQNKVPRIVHSAETFDAILAEMRPRPEGSGHE